MNQWTGTLEQRELRRAQLIGEAWVSGWRANPGKPATWIPLISGRTRLRDRWLWSSRYLNDEKFDGSRARLAGESLLSVFADGTQSRISAYWFNAAAKTDEWSEGWLFDEECLQADGWVETAGQKNGKPWRGWHKPGS